MIARCAWAGRDPLMMAYHDDEWGVPLHDDRRLFEFLILEGAQAGLSWRTILAKRDRYRTAFLAFDPARVAAFDADDLARLLQDPGIVRNRAKLAAAVGNARVVRALQAAHGSLDAYLWRFVGGQPIQNAWPSGAAIPAETPLARELSKALRAAGLRFVGPTICYAFMQAVGMVNDHEVGCYRWAQLGGGALGHC